MEAGTKLSPYGILAPIGAGGMGEVYRARDLRLKCRSLRGAYLRQMMDLDIVQAEDVLTP